MRDLLVLAIHLLVTLAKLLRPGGVRRVAVESTLLKHQLLIGSDARPISLRSPTSRNTLSPHWRMWLKPENRCLVPANSFVEYAPELNPETKKKDVVWFALMRIGRCSHSADTWTTFNGDRGTNLKPISGPHQVYGFLTTAPNAAVAP